MGLPALAGRGAPDAAVTETRGAGAGTGERWWVAADWASAEGEEGEESDESEVGETAWSGEVAARPRDREERRSGAEEAEVASADGEAGGEAAAEDEAADLVPLLDRREGEEADVRLREDPRDAAADTICRNGRSGIMCVGRRGHRGGREEGVTKRGAEQGNSRTHSSADKQRGKRRRGRQAQGNPGACPTLCLSENAHAPCYGA